jgi:glycosyltransferase involved in cell wall biosynthesis
MDGSNHPLRVAHIITQLELGGAQRNTLYTIGHLDKSRFEPTLLCGPGGLLDEEAKRGSWTTIEIPSLIRQVHPIKDARALYEIYKQLRRLKPHIVHTHSSKAGILGRIAAYLAGVPVIIHTFHGFGFTPGQSPFVRHFFVRLERCCAHLSTHLIFVSKANQKEAAQLHIGTEKPSSLIRSGIEIKKLSSPSPEGSTPSKNIRREQNIPEEAWMVISVGNFKPQKNPMDLVRVAEKVLAEDRSIHFVFAGDGELRKMVQTYAEALEIAAHIHFLGWRQDIPQILTESNCFFLTSLWEGLPRALVEAYAAGLPAVAYAVDGVQDILLHNETGFAIDPNDIDFAAKKILWLKQNPEDARRMGQEGKKLVSEEFEIDSMVRQQESLYDATYVNVPLRDYYEPTWTPVTR